MEKHCSMKGYLEFSILLMISKKSMSGNEIRSELGNRRGCIPSPGTIYPAIKMMKTKGLIKEISVKSLKEKKYSITKKGKKEVIENKKLFFVMFKELFV